MLDSILESLHVVALPTKTNFRSIEVREVALIRGPAGWGEFSPFLEYGPEESLPWLQSAIESAYLSPPALLRSKIDVNATLPAVNGREKIEEVLSWYPGCQVAKIKVGDNFEDDLNRIRIAQEVIPGLQIRLDVNGLWSVQQACQYLGEIFIHAGHIQYVEQPCATIQELRELKRVLDVPILIAGDEVLRKAKDPFAIDLDGAVDIVMLKVAPLGGIARSLRLANHHGLPVVVSSALESAIGILHGLRLAGVLPKLNYACGLATGSLLGADVAHFPIIDGAIEIVDVVPSIQSLTEFAVPQDRLLWWQERIKKIWDLGLEKEGWAR